MSATQPRQQQAYKSDQLCHRVQEQMSELKVSIGKECDDILAKIDELLATEILAFEKAVEYCPKADDATSASAFPGAPSKFDYE